MFFVSGSGFLILKDQPECQRDHSITRDEHNKELTSALFTLQSILHLHFQVPSVSEKLYQSCKENPSDKTDKNWPPEG